MTSPRPSRHSQPAPAEPELSRLEPPGKGGASGWRLAALVLTVGLVGVIAAGRLGMEEMAGEPTPRSSPVAAASPSPSRQPAVSPSVEQPSPAPSARATLPPSVDAVPDVARYLDGLPTSIEGEKVHRLETALARAGDRTVLVGGWYMAPDCSRLALCPHGLLADNPADSRNSTRAFLKGRLPDGNGAVVVRARVSDCPERRNCAATMEVFEQVWGGDLYTRAGPIQPMALLGALSVAFPHMRAEPFRDLARCPVTWPPQTYRSTTGGPRMIVIFPTVEDRLATEQAIRTNWPQPASYPGAQCLDQFMDQGEPAGWIAEDNVMLWAAQFDDVRALTRAAVLDARSHSVADEQPVPQPLTAWRAISGLQRWEADLEVLPPHEVLVWGPQLHLREGQRPAAQAYALSDPLIRLLLVFPDSAARRTYQRDVAVADVLVLGRFPASQEELAAAMLEARAADLRWLGQRNLLLQVSGSPRFDEDLREFVRGLD